MDKLYVLVGSPAAGKSTMAENLYENLSDINHSIVDIFSSDEYRTEMFGSLSEGNNKANNAAVFNKLHDDLKRYIKYDLCDYGIYDATNLSRKRRRSLYNNVKEWSKGETEVEIVYFLKPLSKLIKSNSERSGDSFVPESIIKKMYVSQQIPRAGVDCDSFGVVGDSMFESEGFDISRYTGNKDGSFARFMHKELTKDFKQEFGKIFSNHDCAPHHLETIEQHIQLCVQRSMDMIPNAKNTKQYYSNLVLVSMFHDLGKSVTKTTGDRDGTKKASYIGHANVSANYMLNYFLNKNDGFISDSEMDIVEVIFQHMNSHQGITQKNINKNKLNDNIVSMLKDFRMIDDISRIKGDE